jgi:lysophospholipase L1-like esterase
MCKPIPQKKRLFSLFIVSILLGFSHAVFAQFDHYRWFDPAAAPYPVLDGRAWQKELAAPYDRLPAKAEKVVRTAVWNLSRNSAGQYIGFKTNATTVVVKLVVKDRQAMPHMPATGVSGVDLYAKDAGGMWRWAKGSYTFGDTIQYVFANMVLSAPEEAFRLYLPLYNTVTWLNIGTPSENSFTVLPVSDSRPIVAYGTSIMHGACASRPGLAWTNILGRKLNSTVINLGFSGNGQLEQPMIDLINEIDAKLYVLDCIPNLADRSKFSAEEVEKRIRKAVADLQEKHPGTPVLLAEHCCGLEGINMDGAMTSRYRMASELAASVYRKMRKEGIKHIYHLGAREIGFDIESTVDGTHPNDIGMMKYAEAYARIIAKIL